MLPEVRAAAARLEAAGVASPRHDAEALAAHVLGVPRSRLLLTDAFDGPAADRYAELVEQRAARVPLQHLTGVAYFRHLALAVGPGVFVPRPETELLAGAAIDALSPGDLAVDLCTGSGAVALAVAQEAPGVRVHAVELDPHALAWAERNVAATGLPVTLHRGDVADPSLLASLDGAVDVVRAVERAAARLLRPGGLVAVEHADAQGASVPAVFRGWADVADHRDLAGRPRYTTARLRT